MWNTLATWTTAHPSLALGIGLMGLVILALIAHLLARFAVLPLIERAVRRTRITWDEALLDAGFFRRLVPLAPALVLYFGGRLVAHLSGLTEFISDSDDSTLDPARISLVTSIAGPLYRLIANVALATMAVVGARALSALLDTVNTLYTRRPISRNRPIKGYIQIIKIVLFIVTGIIALSLVMDTSPVIFLSGLGAMTAVLMLIFRDTILGLVAAIQLSSNDMVRVGDWIEMPACGADGDVMDIALHTVKVQNFDKTITTIPTHMLISSSFRNWRGMQECGGRRIMRSIHIDVHSVRFLNDDEVERFAHFELLKDYIAGKRVALDAYNAAHPARDDTIPNIRRLTNIGTFRAWIQTYLQQKEEISDTLLMLIRQLEPTEHGLPLQIYAFTTTTDWATYEAIQADVFDHIIAMAETFDLRLFQDPSGADFRRLLKA